MPTAKAGAQCRVPVPSPPPHHGGRRDWWGQARPMGAVSHRPHARAHQHRTLGKPPGQTPSQQKVLAVPTDYWCVYHQRNRQLTEGTTDWEREIDRALH
jgi:hypothetical protein